MRPLLKIPGGTFLQIQTDIYISIYITYLAEFLNSKHTSKPGGGDSAYERGGDARRKF